jgi:hypothetical protein
MNYTLEEQFIDRAGRTVYAIKDPLGDTVGQIRMYSPNQNWELPEGSAPAEVDWAQD